MIDEEISSLIRYLWGLKNIGFQLTWIRLCVLFHFFFLEGKSGKREGHFGNHSNGLVGQELITLIWAFAAHSLPFLIVLSSSLFVSVTTSVHPLTAH